MNQHRFLKTSLYLRPSSVVTRLTRVYADHYYNNIMLKDHDMQLLKIRNFKKI